MSSDELFELNVPCPCGAGVAVYSYYSPDKMYSKPYGHQEHLNCDVCSQRYMLCNRRLYDREAHGHYETRLRKYREAEKNFKTRWILSATEDVESHARKQGRSKKDWFQAIGPAFGLASFDEFRLAIDRAGNFHEWVELNITRSALEKTLGPLPEAALREWEAVLDLKERVGDEPQALHGWVLGL